MFDSLITQALSVLARLGSKLLASSLTMPRSHHGEVVWQTTDHAKISQEGSYPSQVIVKTQPGHENYRVSFILYKIEVYSHLFITIGFQTVCTYLIYDFSKLT